MTGLPERANIFPNVNTDINIRKYIVRFRDFETRMQFLPAFNLNDVRKFDPGFHREQLSDWLGREYIKPLAGGYYLLADIQVDESTLFMLANKIYEPSYVSLESALAYYQVIPEAVLGVTSVSSRKTKQFDIEWGRLSYRSIKPCLMFGYQVVEKDKKIKYKIASLEKAVLDYLYRNSDIESSEDFEGLRWNKERLRILENNTLFGKYLNIFNNQALERKVETMMEYIHA